MATLLSKIEEDHEAWKSRLVDDVFGKDNMNKVQMEKVVMLLWQFRDDGNVIQFMAQFVAKFAGSRDVFAGIEFYLPQLAHMIIHLEVDWDDAIFERFALMIAQQSLHFALQLNWILVAAIEDYEPELPTGEPNPEHNAIYYSRCVKLLSNIERCVVYGRPRSIELYRLYERGKITKKEYEILEHADRRFNAVEITTACKDGDNDLYFSGPLLYKRQIRNGCCKPKPWKTRYFSIQNRMLNCYNEKGGTLIRSMPLEGAALGDHTGKYPHMFFVQNRGFLFVMRATSAEEKEKWLEELREEAMAHALFAQNTSDSHKRFLEDLTPAQRVRFDFFKNERDFCRNICEIAETLRFKERAERKILAPQLLEGLVIPPCVYVPLCNSTDIWKRVCVAIAKDTRVFNTKERCPIIMYFVARRGEVYNRSGLKDVNLDVAEYMHLQFAILEEEKIMESIVEETFGELGTPHGSSADLVAANNEDDAKDADEDMNKSNHSAISSVWHDTELEAGKGRHPVAKGNRQVQVFLRENLVALPKKIGNRIDSRRRLSTKTILDKAKDPIETVPILEGHSSFGLKDDDDDTSVVSIERGSVLVNASAILGDQDFGDIGICAIEQAKDLVCGGESYAEKTKRMLEEVVGEEEGVTEVSSLMAKSNDDLRQEVFVMQMIHFYKSVFAKAGLPLWLKTYRILSISQRTGLIEVLTDATSLDGLKKSEKYPKEGGLRAYFIQVYGAPESKSFKAAQKNFMTSLAAYSLVSYLLGLKDRHNGNIMIDTRGHIIQIDFGFAMGMAPGNDFSMEQAPFKFTKEYVDVMGGLSGTCYKEFKALFIKGFVEARKNSLIALGLVEIMMYKSRYPCFTGRQGHGVALKKFEKRLLLDVPDNQIERRAEDLIRYGLCSFDCV